MKLDVLMDALNNDTANILIMGGECSGKSHVLEAVALEILKNNEACVMSTSSKVKEFISKKPDSKYIYKSNHQAVDYKEVQELEQDYLLIDGDIDIPELLANTSVGKRLIVTYSGDDYERLPAYLSIYFPVIVKCGVLDEETKEKGIQKIRKF